MVIGLLTAGVGGRNGAGTAGAGGLTDAVGMAEGTFSGRNPDRNGIIGTMNSAALRKFVPA